ncbi:YciI family protein [Humibacillus xanthopallidus]|uniref:YciI family protein n=1 Tax=Humibacillus xanthopallidus TaxID=412689 RepID=UPI00384A67A2
MADTYVYLIHESDWDSDALLGGGPDVDMNASFPEHEAFQKAVADLGARIVGGAALQNSRHGGTVTPGATGRLVEEAVYTDGPFTDTSEVISGFYLVETDDEDTARRIAALVPTGGHTEWRKVFPSGM